MADRFLPGVTERLGWYVYLLTDPRNEDEVFYVGKGTGHRCFAHVSEALGTRQDIVHGFEKLRRIREIGDDGYRVGIDVLAHGLDEREALMIEAAAIDLLGLDLLTNRVAGHRTLTRGRRAIGEINALYARQVEIDPEHPVVLVNIRHSYLPGMSEEDLYERTRQWWPIAEWRRRIGAPGTPKWAFSIGGGVVRAVYRIDAWEPATADAIDEDPKRARRWAFRGERDLEMEKQYLYGDVSRYVTSQWPLRFITDPSDYIVDLPEGAADATPS